MTLIVLFAKCAKNDLDDFVSIPDDAFLNALIELGIDSNKDGVISPAEAEVISYLNVSGEFLSEECCTIGNISDLTGIEAFINLDTLICSYNQIISLDLVNNPSISRLDCGNTFIEKLDLSNNQEMQIPQWARGLYLDTIPSLYEVCVWTLPFPPEGLDIDTTGSPNIYFATECDK